MQEDGIKETETYLHTDMQTCEVTQLLIFGQRQNDANKHSTILRTINQKHQSKPLFFIFPSSHSSPVSLQFKCNSSVYFFHETAGKLRNGQSKQMKLDFNPQFSEMKSGRKREKPWRVQPS